MKWLKDDSYGLPVLLAVGLHAVILVAGVVAVDFSDDEKQQPKRPVIVNATVIDISDTIIGKREAEERAAKQQAANAAAKRKQEAEQKRKKEAEQKALEAREKQLAQAKRVKEREAAEAAARKEKERQQVAEQKRLEQENEKKRLAQEKEREKQRLEKQAEEERKRKEQELIRQAEAERLADEERKRQAEAARLAEEKKQAEEAAAQAAAAEQERLRAAEEAQMVQSISSLINSRITSVWNRPPNARNGMKTQLRIYFLPNGEVRDTQVTKGSGDALFDQRAVDAVYKVGRIEELADVDSYTFERNFRQIDLIFNPQDLRN
ncbi:cell envelope integrity protein TolA [Marinomonas sp. 2405UD66-6]|uniref:cell envelope integrity protein TolA n=1 Tax=Marinomonas sp. 2405UD66-6 TaxID=3391834 RepID=UPI0039C9E7B4